MASMVDREPVSEETVATLLLCATLGKRPQGAPHPLSPAEYYSLLGVLRELNVPRSALVGADTALLEAVTGRLTGAVRQRLDSGRLLSLLERGALLGLSLARWESAGIWIVSHSDRLYPSRYKSKLRHVAPPLVFGIGSPELMERGGLAVVGSRQPDPASATSTVDVGRWAATAGVQIVSGAASGVDEMAMLSCAQSGGTALGVVADSLVRTSTQRGFREQLIKGRLALLSSYDPDAGFTVGNAMGRNRWVHALADRSLVMACSEGRGGTWAGAVEALKHGVRVFVKTGNPARPGNDALLAHGALPLPEDLGEILKTTNSAAPAKPSIQTGDVYSLVAPLILEALQTPKTARDLANTLGLVTTQTTIWLNRLIAEGKVEKTHMTYSAIGAKSYQPSLFTEDRRNSSAGKLPSGV